jgi:hypothetical protein
MSQYYDNHQELAKLSKARELQFRMKSGEILRKNFEENVLLYLDEPIIGHLCDSLFLEENGLRHSGYTDFSFLTAPAYKAFEGFLFQIAKDLKLPSGKDHTLVGGYYYDSTKIEKAIDNVISDLEKTTGKVTNNDRKDHIMANVTAMRLFLKTYRHTPAHFFGKPLETKEMALNHVHSIYKNINDTVSVLQESGLITIVPKPPKR